MNPMSKDLTIWNYRECCTAALCANLPRIYPVSEYLVKFASRSQQSMLDRLNRVSRPVSSSNAAALNVPSPNLVLVSRNVNRNSDTQTFSDARTPDSVEFAKTKESVDMKTPRAG
jgi:hypothetical protein